MKTSHDLIRDLDHLEMDLIHELNLYGGRTARAMELKAMIYRTGKELELVETTLKTEV